MADTLNMFLVDDNAGVGLSRPDGSAIGGPPLRVSLLGACTVYEPGAHGSNIINDPKLNDCDLSGAKSIKITLQFNPRKPLGNATFAADPAAGATPALCIHNSATDKICNRKFVKRLSLGDDNHQLVVNLQGLPKHRYETSTWYSLNFNVPGQREMVSLDPKIINRPRDESILLQLLAGAGGTALLIALILLPALASFALGRSLRRRAGLRPRG